VIVRVAVGSRVVAGVIMAVADVIVGACAVLVASGAVACVGVVRVGVLLLALVHGSTIAEAASI
jgi:hypothetical protein